MWVKGTGTLNGELQLFNSSFSANTGPNQYPTAVTLNTTTWQQLSLTFTTPANTANIVFGLYNTNAATTTAWYVDDVT